MTRQELIDEVSRLRGELHAITQPHIARMNAYEGWANMEDRVSEQDNSARKEWWLKQLDKIKPLMVQFDVINAENFRLNKALDQQVEISHAYLSRIKELEQELTTVKTIAGF